MLIVLLMYQHASWNVYVDKEYASTNVADHFVMPCQPCPVCEM